MDKIRVGKTRWDSGADYAAVGTDSPAAAWTTFFAASAMDCGLDQVQARVAENLPGQFDVVAFQPHHQGQLQVMLLHRRHDAVGDDVAAHDAAKDVHQDRFHVRVAGDDLEGRQHLVGEAPPPTSRKLAGRPP